MTKHTLMTLQEFRDKYKPIAIDWEEDDITKPIRFIRLNILLNGIKLYWVINEDMKNMFGYTWKFKEIYNKNYTHRTCELSDSECWNWHKDWFIENNYFFSIKDFEL